MFKILLNILCLEAKGPMIDEYKDRFQRQSFNHFESLIADYNGLITSSQLVYAIHVYLDKIEQDKTLKPYLNGGL
jgi:hypothetical protein